MACPNPDHADIADDQHALLAELAVHMDQMSVDERIDVFRSLTRVAVDQFIALAVDVCGDEEAAKLRTAIEAL